MYPHVSGVHLALLCFPAQTAQQDRLQRFGFGYPFQRREPWIVDPAERLVAWRLLHWENGEFQERQRELIWIPEFKGKGFEA